MEPTSFTQTSFCGSTVDNITDNDTKEYILSQMGFKCGGITYQSRYAKVYNPNYKKNMENPHILCLKSSGTPYLLFLTQINETNYSFLIDKKIKDGYSYPKIFSVPYSWNGDVYEGTLMECELIRDRQKRWSLGIGDVYYLGGQNVRQTIIMERIQKLHDMFSTQFNESEFCNTCPPFVKRYFDYREVPHIIDEFVPTLPYDIRGFYFVPLRCSYSKIIYLLPRDNPMNQRPPKTHGSVKAQGSVKAHGYAKTHGSAAHGYAKAQNSAVQNSAISGVPSEKMDSSTKVAETRLLRIMKTMKPDVYEVYSETNDSMKKLGLALVQTKDASQRLKDAFEGKTPTSEVRLECAFHDRFKKWYPV